MNEKVRKMGTVQLGDKKKDEVDISKMEEKNNQKFGLCKSLIDLGDWKMAKSIIDRNVFLFYITWFLDGFLIMVYTV